MEWCAVHNRYCVNTKSCISNAVSLYSYVGGVLPPTVPNEQVDPTDFIIEKSIVVQSAWHNSRVNYRLKQWKVDISRYEFVCDGFWIGNIYSVLRNNYGIAKPEETVAVVDLTDF